MIRKIITESPFEYLRRQKTNEAIAENTVKNWYIARAFVLQQLKGVSFGPGSEGHLHAVVDGDSPLMLAVVRQLALSAHFLNYTEQYKFSKPVCKNRSVITLVTQKETEKIVGELEEEENLCNLLKFCKYTVFGEERNSDSFIDIELEIVNGQPDKDGTLWIDEKAVQAYVELSKEDEIYKIDTRKAVFARRSYDLGVEIDNLPHLDILDADRYRRALDIFQRKVLQDKKGQELIDGDWKKSLTDVKLGLSNLFCSDCFESRDRDIRKAVAAEGKDYEHLSDKEKKAVWGKYSHELSLSEHSRWVVEKLIMGFLPLNEQERAEYESLFGKKKTDYIKSLKNRSDSPAHLNLCSYRDLRRTDPDNMKYDGFLMLAIPLILAKTSGNGRR